VFEQYTELPKLIDNSILEAEARKLKSSPTSIVPFYVNMLFQLIIHVVSKVLGLPLASEIISGEFSLPK
jgi:hypothetical protein